MQKIKTVDLFSGCGGLSLGFQNVGFDIIAAYDNWKPAIDVYRMNFGHSIYEQDLADKQIQENIKKCHPISLLEAPPAKIFHRLGIEM